MVSINNDVNLVQNSLTVDLDESENLDRAQLRNERQDASSNINNLKKDIKTPEAVQLAGAGDLGDEMILSKPASLDKPSLAVPNSPEAVQSRQLEELEGLNKDGKFKNMEPAAIVIAETYVSAQLLPEKERQSTLAEKIEENNLTDLEDSKTVNTFVQSSKILGSLNTNGQQLQEAFSNDLDATITNLNQKAEKLNEDDDLDTVPFTNISVDRLTIDADEDIKTELAIDKKAEEASKRVLNSKLDQLEGERASLEADKANKALRLNAAQISSGETDEISDEIASSIGEELSTESEIIDSTPKTAILGVKGLSRANSKSDSSEASAELAGAESSLGALENQIESIRSQLS